VLLVVPLGLHLLGQDILDQEALITVLEPVRNMVLVEADLIDELAYMVSQVVSMEAAMVVASLVVFILEPPMAVIMEPVAVVVVVANLVLDAQAQLFYITTIKKD
jgi:hypothetical protein